MKQQAIAQQLYAEHTLLEQALTLSLCGCHIRVQSNSAALLQRLHNYFAYVVADDRPDADISIHAIEREAVALKLGAAQSFCDWKREPGKQNRKDSHIDLEHARILRKVRTGMVFLQSQSQLIAAGPCLKNDNQMINFIIAQYMNRLQQQDWLICHAAGLTLNDSGIAIAGFSGGGKSTLMLQLLELNNSRFLSNDRLFIHQGKARGVPKQPRINPGTIIHQPRLQPLMPAEERQRLQQLPSAELWQREQKYDACIDQLFGNDRLTLEADLHAVIILNWQHNSTQPTRLEAINITEQPTLLAALMKSPGPFYQDRQGRFLAGSQTADPAMYQQQLSHCRVYQIHGKVDFAAAVNQIQHALNLSWPA